MVNKADIAKYLVSVGLGASVALGGGYLIFPHEGEVRDRNGQHVVYADPIGIPTACWGLTGKDLYGKPFKVGDKYSQGECLEMFAPVLNKFAKGVDALVRTPYSSPYQRASLISFAYNVGLGNFKSSTLLKLKNSGNEEAVCDQLSRWVYAKKKKLKGLEIRREEEKAWCLGQVPHDVTVIYSELVDLAIDTWGTEDGKND